MSARTTPGLAGIDHVHVHVVDRAAAVQWYRRVLGFEVMPEFAFWQADGGPLTVADAAGSVHIALFEAGAAAAAKNRTTIALRTDAAGLVAWRAHLASTLGQAPRVEDHDLSLSLYFSDPDGNPYEITTYEHAAARAALG